MKITEIGRAGFCMTDLVNARVPIEDVEAGMFILRSEEETVDRVYGIKWSRPCGWYEVLFYDHEREPTIVYPGAHFTQIIPVTRL